MKKYIPITFLTLAFLVAIITRFYKLGLAPAGLYLDEAAQGYNAYSILKTGKDEFGKWFPIVFRSFNDFKTPVYIYLIVPLLPIFDLTKFTVRFPSFFFSILTIPVIYLLIKEIAPKKHGEILGAITAILLSISPWHILFGRTNFECNVALFFSLTGFYFFYKSLQKPSFLILSAIFLAIAIPSYHAQRVVTPLLSLALFLRHKDLLLSKSHRIYLIPGLIISAIILIPTISVSFTPGFLARAAGLNIFSHQNQLPAGYLENYEGPFSAFINNSWFLTSKEFIALYFSYFSPRNMFILGDYGPRSSFPGLSTFFIWQFPFYIIGIYRFLRSKKLSELKYFTLTFLLIAPLPAAVTRDPYSSIRSLQMVIPILIIMGYGILNTYEHIMSLINQRHMKLSVFYFSIGSISSFILIYSLLKLYSSVLVLNEYYRASEWNYGFEQVSDRIKTLDPKLPIVVDNARSEPYSQLLFFLKFDPKIYQEENFEVTLNEYYTNMNRNKTKVIGNIVTRPISWKEDLITEKYLIGDNLSVSYEQIKNNNLTLIDEIHYPDGSLSFIIVRTNP